MAQDKTRVNLEIEHFDWNLKWKSVIERENGHWKVEMGVQSIKI